MMSGWGLFVGKRVKLTPSNTMFAMATAQAEAKKDYAKMEQETNNADSRCDRSLEMPIIIQKYSNCCHTYFPIQRNAAPPWICRFVQTVDVAITTSKRYVRVL